MLNLELTTDKLSVITDTASGTLAVHVSFTDVDQTTLDPSGLKKQNTAISGATTTDIVAVPGATTTRNVKLIQIRNTHASISETTTVQFNANATLYELFKCILLTGEELVMREGVWFHYDSNGGVYGQALPVASDTVVGGIEIATQAEMEAKTSTVVAVTPGRQHFHPGHPKAWLSCGVAADIQQSYNIASLTDTGTGIVTITIDVDFAAATYCILADVEMTGTTFAVASARECSIRSATRAVGSVAVNCIDDTATTELVKDPTTYHVAMFGDFA